MNCLHLVQCMVLINTVTLFQELRSREEEITKAAVQQKMQEEFLRKREKELAEREIELVERELNIMILQQIMNKPTPKKRKGKFKKSRLKLLKSGGKNISTPSGNEDFFVRQLFMPCKVITAQGHGKPYFSGAQVCLK